MVFFSSRIDRSGFFRDELHPNGKVAFLLERLSMHNFNMHPLNYCLTMGVVS